MCSKMSFVKALANKILQNNTRKLEEQDIWRLYHLVHFYKAIVTKGGQLSENEPDLHLPEQSVSLAEQYRVVHVHIKDQVATRLGKDTANDCTTLQPLPRRGSSPIPGVSVRKGRLLPGTFVCFFPGTVYVPSQLREMPNYPNIADDNPYLMARTDGSIIDARNTALPSDGKSLAVGHFVRHPPQGALPNVMPFSFDVGTDFPRELLPLIPNKPHRKPGSLFSDRSVVLRTIVFVAMRYIKEGEEIFLNYRLHPKSAVPDWYSSVEASEDKKRWNT